MNNQKVDVIKNANIDRVLFLSQLCVNKSIIRMKMVLFITEMLMLLSVVTLMLKESIFLLSLKMVILKLQIGIIYF